MGLLTDVLFPCIEELAERTKESADNYRESYDETYEEASERDRKSVV